MRRLIASALTAVVALTGCTDGDAVPPPDALPDSDIFALPGDLELVAALQPFDDCDELLTYVKDAALRLVTPYGLEGGGWWGPWPVDGVRMTAEGAVDEDTAADGAGAPSPADPVGSSETGTNVQEVGVDEPDRVKTDGSYLYTLHQDRLRVLDIRGADPVEVGGLDLRDAYDAQLLLAGDHLLVTSSGMTAVPFPGAVDAPAGDLLPPWPGSGTTTLTLVDVRDPARPTVTERLTIDGATLSARLIDGVARVVVRTEQGRLPWVYPQTSGLRAEREALAANRDLIRASVIEDWLPYRVHETAGGRATEGTLLDCAATHRPEAFSGLGVVSVVTVDVAAGRLSADRDAAVGVLAGGDTVYASRDRLYVSTARWFDWEGVTSDQERTSRAQDLTTEIHAFDLGDPARATYVASGEVPGTLLSQWAMSEYEGVLRVASTVGDTWWGSGGPPSRSMVTTLVEDGPTLRQLGQVDGLGVTERIYAVRFLGDTGYVVTFRQVDPLYTLDLSDPAAPAVVGELKILGYSAYLHPVGDGLLLGVGQDADDEGRTKGTQLSLFDVADPAVPTRLDQVTLDDASSDVEHDHRAFLHDPASGLTVVPFTRYRYDERTGQDDIATGALAFTATRADGLARLGTIEHVPAWLEDVRRDLDEAGDLTSAEQRDWLLQERLWEWAWQGAISRSVVADGRLFTVSELGVAVHDVEGLRELGWLAYDD